MKALIVKLLGVAGIIAKYLFSKQGKLVMTWAARAVGWVKAAEDLKDTAGEPLKGAAKFQVVGAQVIGALIADGVFPAGSVPEGTVRKIVEMAHGAWLEEVGK